jgi:hypothetical protein
MGTPLETRERLSSTATQVYRWSVSACALGADVKLMAIGRTRLAEAATGVTWMSIVTLIILSIAIVIMLKFGWEAWRLSDMWMLDTSLEVRGPRGTRRIPLSCIQQVTSPRWSSVIEVRTDPLCATVRRVFLIPRKQLWRLGSGVER